jgi:hypothetical protein
MAGNLAIVSGSTSRVVQYFPEILAAVGLLGGALALRMKRRCPTAYAALRQTFS